MKHSFFGWYYTDGLRALFRITKDILRFIVRYFSLALLLRTFFAPWRRDVEIRDWHGLHPLRALHMFFDNFFARVMGMLMRTIVITSVIVMLVAGCVVAVVGLLFAFCTPLLLFFLLFLFFSKTFLAVSSVLLVAICAVIGAFFLSYRRAQQLPYARMSIGELARQKWFRRVWGRMGVRAEDVPADILRDFDAFREFLATLSLTTEDFKKILSIEIMTQQKAEQSRAWWQWETLRKKTPLARWWHYGYTVHLDDASTDVTRRGGTKDYDVELVDHREALSMIELVLQRPSGRNALLVGGPGIGKKTVVYALAQRIREGFYDGTSLAMRRILFFHIEDVIMRAEKEGVDVRASVDAFFREAARAGNVTLVVDHFDRYVGATDGESAAHVKDILEDYLALPQFSLIGLATNRRFHHAVERQETILKDMEVVEVGEMTPEETARALVAHFCREERRRILFTYHVLRRIVEYATQNATTTLLPEYAIDLATEVLLFWAKNQKTDFVTDETVDAFIQLKTGVPTGAITEEERAKLLSLEDELGRRIISQEEAVRQVAEAVRRMRSGIGNTKKPLGTFLFLGPTGVGKTATAKALAGSYFGDEERMVRLDMSEFHGEDAIGRLIGQSEHDNNGYLTTLVKDHQFSLLLLDEIEKAHPNVLDLFLQILDEGLVTSATGERVSFRHMIIIATSNAGAMVLRDLLAQNEDMRSTKDQLIEFIVRQGIFRVEFLNRFDDVILFHPLEGEELRAVCQILLTRFAQRLEKEKNIRLSFAQDVVEKIIEKGYNTLFGARSIEHYINDRIEDVVARKIISGEILRGESMSFTANDLQ